MSFIPNTTPTPNWLYNGEMKKMSDTELRIVLCVTRKTLGWIENKETGMRKQEDWIAHSELIKMSGKSSRAISSAVDNCVKHGWIETRDKNGKLLKTSNERRRRRIFYRLGDIFTSKLSTANSMVDSNLPQLTTESTANNDTNLPQKRRNTKETITKETIQKVCNASVADKLNNEILIRFITSFKEVNPTYEALFNNKTERGAAERLLNKFGEEKLNHLMEQLPNIISQKYAPRITTPYQLEKKMGDLITFVKQERSEQNNKAAIIV